MSTQRQGIQDPNQQRARSAGPSQLSIQDSFGVERAQPSVQTDTLSTLAKFGEKVAVDSLKKQAQSDFVAGQALRAAGEQLKGTEPPPSRKGFKALDAKLRAQDWFFEQKAAIDNGENDLDPTEYSQVMSQRFSELLTGDAETDQILTQAMAQYSPELGRYQASANTKKRHSDGINQATTDVRNHLLAIQSAKDSGDPVGEHTARMMLEESLSLPTVQNESVRNKLYSDLAVMGLEMGDPAVLDYTREQGMQFDPKQERAVIKAVATYNNQQKRKLDVKYQNDTADFEAKSLLAKSQDEFRELRDEYAEKHSDRVSNDYLVNAEANWLRAFNKGITDKYAMQLVKEGKAAGSGLTAKQIQTAMDSTAEQVLTDPTLDPQVAEANVRDTWKSNGIKWNKLAQELTAGLSVPMVDGRPNPKFVAAYDKAYEYYKEAPDLLKKHLPEDQLKLFLNTKTAVTYGGQVTEEVVARMAEMQIAPEDLSREQRATFDQAIIDATDDVLGKGMFNFEHGITTSLNNEAEIKQRIHDLARMAMSQGITEPEAAVEYAREMVRRTHEQLGNSLVFNDGTPIHERMGIPADRVQDAMEYVYNDLAETYPTIDFSDTVLLGDPKSDRLLVGVKNEFGAVSRTVIANLPEYGRQFEQNVIVPENLEHVRKESVAAQAAEDARALRDEALASGIYNEETFEAANSNIIGRTVMKARVSNWKANQIDLNRIQQYGLESEEELYGMRVLESIMAKGRVDTETAKQLEAGELDLRAQEKVDISTLNDEELFIFEKEGFSSTVYADLRHGDAVPTVGVGQTGEFMDKSFKETVKIKRELTEKLIPKLNTFPKDVQANLVSSVYRGALSGSPKTLALINRGEFQKAAKEFLDNAEYREAKAPGSKFPGIASRMEEVAEAIASLK